MYVLIYLPIFNSIFNKSNLRMSIGYLQPLVRVRLDTWTLQIALVASRLAQFCENFENTREINP